MSRKNKHRNCLYLLALVAMGLSSFTQSSHAASVAAPSEDLAATQPSPAMETLISQLEAKAKALGDGTWTFAAGPQDQPSANWTTGAGGGDWYCRMMVPQPSAFYALTLYSNGSETFLLPANQRFESDSLLRGEVADLRTGRWMFLANLHPRQFLSEIKDLHIIGDVTIDGVQYSHLSTFTPKVDKPRSSVATTRTPLPSMDLWIDFKRQAIAKVSSVDFNGYTYETQVKSWDGFGQAGSWPKALLCKTFVTTAPQINAAKPVVTTVQAFAAGKDDALSEISRRVAVTPFFSAPPEDMQSVAVYQKMLTQHPEDQTAHVSLAQAAFSETDLRTGLAEWKKVEEQLSDADAKHQLAGVLMPPASNALWDGSAKPELASASIQLIKQFESSLTHEQYKGACPAVFSAWVNLRNDKANTVALIPLNAILLERFVTCGSVYVFRNLLDLAERSKTDEVLIAPYLNQVAKWPLPVAGLQDSQLSYFLIAAIDRQDTKRAADLLAAPVWDPQTPESAKQIVGVMAHAVATSADVKERLATAVAEAIGVYDQLTAKLLADDAADCSSAKILLIRSTVTGMESLIEKTSSVLDAVAIVNRSEKVPSADKFFDQVIGFLAQDHHDNPDWLSRNLGPLADAYSSRFGKPEFACQIWLHLAQDHSAVGKLLNIQVGRLNKALAAAPDDKWRIRVITQLAGSYARVREFTKGKLAVRGAAALVTEVSAMKQINTLLDMLAKAQTQDDQRVASSAQVNDKNITHGQIAFMQQQLDQAKKQQVSAADISSLEMTLHNLQTTPASGTP